MSRFEDEHYEKLWQEEREYEKRSCSQQYHLFWTASEYRGIEAADEGGWRNVSIGKSGIETFDTLETLVDYIDHYAVSYAEDGGHFTPRFVFKGCLDEQGGRLGKMYDLKSLRVLMDEFSEEEHMEKMGLI